MLGAGKQRRLGPGHGRAGIGQGLGYRRAGAGSGCPPDGEGRGLAGGRRLPGGWGLPRCRSRARPLRSTPVPGTEAEEVRQPGLVPVKVIYMYVCVYIYFYICAYYVCLYI